MKITCIFCAYEYPAKCGAEKPLSEFYKHPGAADGRYNKCKECTKHDVRANRKANLDYYRAFDRERGNRQPTEYLGEYRAKNAEKYKAHSAVSYAIRAGRLHKLDACESCGSQDNVVAHHPSYAEDMRLCVTWLCQGCHVTLHKQAG